MAQGGYGQEMGAGDYSATAVKEASVYDRLTRTATVLRGCMDAIDGLYGQPTAVGPDVPGPMGSRQVAADVEQLAEKIQHRLHELRDQIGTL